MKNTPRDFPPEVLTGPWPMLMPSPADKQYQPMPETPEHFALRTAFRENNSPLPDFLLALLKGAILGGMIFSIIFGIALNETWWFPSWHWAFALAGVGLILFLFGFQRAFLLITAVLFLTTLPSIITQREILVIGGVFLGGGMIARGSIELVPRKSTT